MNYYVKMMSFASTVAIYFVVVLSYIASYFQGYRFCVANNLYGEFLPELVMFIVFGCTSIIILWQGVSK